MKKVIVSIGYVKPVKLVSGAWENALFSDDIGIEFSDREAREYQGYMSMIARREAIKSLLDKEGLEASAIVSVTEN